MCLSYCKGVKCYTINCVHLIHATMNDVLILKCTSEDITCGGCCPTPYEPNRIYPIDYAEGLRCAIERNRLSDENS